MSNDLVALLYLVAGVLFILALRGLSSPETSRRGNYFGMIGMAIAVGTTLAVARPSDPLTWADDSRRYRHRWRYRRRHRAPHPDDGDARARRRLPFAGRHGRGAGGRRRVLCARGLRHRHAWRHPQGKPDRDVLGRRHRRHYLLRIGDRLPQAFRAHVRQADHVTGAPPHQHRARAFCSCFAS